MGKHNPCPICKKDVGIGYRVKHWETHNVFVERKPSIKADGKKRRNKEWMCRGCKEGVTNVCVWNHWYKECYKKVEELKHLPTDPILLRLRAEEAAAMEEVLPTGKVSGKVGPKRPPKKKRVYAPHYLPMVTGEPKWPGVYACIMDVPRGSKFSERHKDLYWNIGPRVWEDPNGSVGDPAARFKGRVKSHAEVPYPPE